MPAERYDSLIIGSGAGGAAAAWQLVQSGQRVLLLEKGPWLPRTAATLDPAVVIEEGRFKSKEAWRDAQGATLKPEEWFNVGGKTKWYGAALMRALPQEFCAEPDFACRGWPLGEADLSPWYAQAARLLEAREFACESDLAALLVPLGARGWVSAPLPMGLAADIVDAPQEARHFDGFASPGGLKADAETRLLAPLTGAQRFTLLPDAEVCALLGAPGNARRVEGVRLRDGREFRARHVLLAAGALHSPRLLARYLDGQALAHLPLRAQVGRNLKLHLLTAVVALGLPRVADLLRKTTALRHPRFAHSSAQPLGFDGELIARLMPAAVPRAVARRLGARAYGFFLQSEDGSHADNRVFEDEAGRPVLDYDAARCPALLAEHHAFVRRFTRDLLRAGRLAVARRIGAEGTAHACGTLVAGDDPRDSVVDGEGRVHGLDGLLVVDGSVLPRSASVNPSLTIFAWSLRVAARLAARARDAA